LKTYIPHDRLPGFTGPAGKGLTKLYFRGLAARRVTVGKALLAERLTVDIG
jgi:hypothetical protein